MTSTTSISTSSLLSVFFFSSLSAVFQCLALFHGVRVVASLHGVLRNTDRPVDAPIRGQLRPLTGAKPFPWTTHEPQAGVLNGSQVKLFLCPC